MKVGELSLADLTRRLQGGLSLRIGPFSVRMRSSAPGLASVVHLMHSHYPVLTDGGISDFHVELAQPRGVRRWFRRQVLFVTDAQTPFEPFPLELAFPLLEWGLNWCIASRAHQFLMLHAAVVEKGGRGIIMPALPGSGKSTLCAALVHRGWRLFSDEFGLLRLSDGRLLALPRPIPLKNESIDVIRRFADDAVLGPLFPKTQKGTVAHVRPPAESVARADETALPAWIIFPAYRHGANFTLEPVPKPRALLRLCGNAFNYQIPGARAFSVAADAVRASECYQLSYGRLDDTIARLDALIENG